MFADGTYISICLETQSSRKMLVRIAGWVLGIGMGVGVYTAFVRCRREDEMLKDKFGEEWREWAGRTRWKLVPGVY